VLDQPINIGIFNPKLASSKPEVDSPKNNKSLPGLSVEQGQMGAGSAPSSLSHADIRRAPFGGCQLPDAILHGKRSLRPRGRAVQCLAAAGFRVRLFSLLELMVAPPACKPDEDTSVI